jgi:hypothetical protein
MQIYETEVHQNWTVSVGNTVRHLLTPGNKVWLSLRPVFMDAIITE